MLYEQAPVDLCRKHWLLDVHLSQTGLGNRTQHDQCLAGSGHRIHEAFGEEVCRCRCALQIIEIHPQALEQQLDITLEGKEMPCTRGVPPVLGTLAYDEHGQMHLLAVGGQVVYRIILSLRLIAVYIAHLEELQVSGLTVQIVGYHFQTAEKQCLAHGVQVGTERVDDHRKVGLGICPEPGIVVGLGQGIVHALHETVGGQQVTGFYTDCLGVRVRGIVVR